MEVAGKDMWRAPSDFQRAGQCIKIQQTCNDLIREKNATVATLGTLRNGGAYHGVCVATRLLIV